MAYRRLQQEIERVFKRIHEGLEVFNHYYERHENAVNQSQKEKLEGDLKKEIKKLQRFREQIKNWQTANEYKDHEKLLEHRKLVEAAMEKYKIVEKGSKTKAYSNESIRQAAEMGNLDDADQDKIDAVEFIESTLQELQKQIETLEAEIDNLSNAKKNRHNDDKIEEIEEFLSRDKRYQENLERIITALYNDSLKPEALLSIKDDITYFLEFNQEPDFAEDDTLFDDLNIGEEIEDDENIDSSVAEITEEIIDEEPVTKIQPQPILTKPIPKKSDSASLLSLPTSIQKKTILKHNGNSNSNIINGHTDSVLGSSNFTLKPATVPIRPAGELKWSMAAAAAAANTKDEESSSNNIESRTSSPETKSSSINPGVNNLTTKRQSTNDNEKNQLIQKQQQQQSEQQAHQQLHNPSHSQKASNIKISEVIEEDIENRGFSSCEKSLFESTDLFKLPPGIQDVIISHVVARSSSPLEKNKFLRNNSDIYEPFQTPIKNPFIPFDKYNDFEKLKSLESREYFCKKWNYIRFNYTSDQIIEKFLKEFYIMKVHNNYELFEELNLLLFYGLYHALTPIEWKLCFEVLKRTNWIQVNQYFWIFNVNNTNNTKLNSQSNFQFIGDFKTFNFFEWKILEKYGYKITNEDLAKPFNSDLFRVRNEIVKSPIGAAYSR